MHFLKISLWFAHSSSTETNPSIFFISKAAEAKHIIMLNVWKQKTQSRIDNPETQTTLGTRQNEDKQNNKAQPIILKR
jgi:hypothetical protein